MPTFLIAHVGKSATNQEGQKDAAQTEYTAKTESDAIALFHMAYPARVITVVGVKIR